MRLSDERVLFLSKQIAQTLKREGLAKIENEAIFAQDVQKIIIRFMQEEAKLDERVRAKIASIKRGIMEHSREWDVLYDQYYNEEMKKL